MRRGFTLVELLSALVVLELGLLGVVGTLVLAHGIMAHAELRERMAVETGLLLDSLHRHGFAGPGRREGSWGTLAWSPVGKGRIVVEVQPARGEGFVVENRVAEPVVVQP